MRLRVRSISASAVLLTMGAWMALAQTPPRNQTLVPPAQAPRPVAGGAIATVGTRGVSRDEFRARESQAFADYRQRLGQEVPEELRPALRRQLIENLIRRELLVLEAQRRGIRATAEQAESELQRDPFFNPDGKFDAERFSVVRTTQPENFRLALEGIQLQLGARLLNDRLEQEFVGSDASLRAAARRSLERADVEFLGLRRSEFSGAYHEPREREVVDWYRSHAEDYRRTARAVLTVLQVDQPPLAEGEAPEGPAGREWKARLRARADSALAAARAGADFEALATEVGSLRRRVAVTPDNFPGFWPAEARDRSAVFAARPGSLLPAVYPGNPGWMVVRVDSVEPARLATLAEVARQIRGELRTAARQHGRERELRELYAQEASKLRTTGWRVRYAVFDEARLSGQEPAPAELERWYRSHQADFSSFDAAAGRIAVKPFAEVRDQVRDRWRAEQRSAALQQAAARVEDSWRRNQRSRDAERLATVREVGPLLSGAVVDTGRAAAALADSFARREFSLRTGTIAWERGRVVYQVYEAVPNFMPPFEQALPGLSEQLSRTESEAQERGARALYERDPKAFASGKLVHFTRLMIERPNPIDVPLSRAEVERYFERNLDKYSAAEVVRARHILVEPKGTAPEAYEDARRRALEILGRARGGEDFAALAKQTSDDVATREKGGDLGTFARGTMLEAFEQAAFRMNPGEISDLVRTEAGWHIILCVDHLPPSAQPLRYVYSNVGWDAAAAKGESLAAKRADSLVAALRTPAQGRAASKKLGLPLESVDHEIGSRKGPAEFVSFLIRVENTPIGQVVPGRGSVRGAGYFVAWVDSITPARAPDWLTARPRALEQYRREAGKRALDAKRAELDSLLASGWGPDSVAALFGGFERVAGMTAGTSLTAFGGSETTDSLVFGTRREPAVLGVGKLSDWLDLPGGWARLRVARRVEPDASRLSAQVESDRRVTLERKLHEYFEGLKQRYPVKILDPRLRDTPLPPPPAGRD